MNCVHPVGCVAGKEALEHLLRSMQCLPAPIRPRQYCAIARSGLPTDLVKQIELLCSAFSVRSTRLLSMTAILLKT